MKNLDDQLVPDDSLPPQYVDESSFYEDQNSIDSNPETTDQHAPEQVLRVSLIIENPRFALQDAESAPLDSLAGAQHAINQEPFLEEEHNA